MVDPLGPFYRSPMIALCTSGAIRPDDLNCFAARGRHAISKTVGLRNSGGKRWEEVALVRSRRSRPANPLSLTPRGVWAVAEAFGSAWKRSSGRRPRGLLSAVVVISTMPRPAFLTAFLPRTITDEHESAPSSWISMKCQIGSAGYGGCQG